MPEVQVDVVVMRHGQQTGWGGHPEPTFEEFQKGATPEDSESDRNAAHLSETGKEQVRQSAERLLSVMGDIKLIIASPHVRAQESAEIIASLIREKLGKEVEMITNELAREIDISPTVFSKEEYERLMGEGGFQKVIETISAMCYHNDSTMGEPIAKVYDRAARLLTYVRRIKKWTTRDKILVVTHGGTGRAIQHVAQHGQSERFDIETQPMPTASFYGLQLERGEAVRDDEFAVIQFGS